MNVSGASCYVWYYSQSIEERIPPVPKLPESTLVCQGNGDTVRSLGGYNDDRKLSSAPIEAEKLENQHTASGALVIQYDGQDGSANLDKQPWFCADEILLKEVLLVSVFKLVLISKLNLRSLSPILITRFRVRGSGWERTINTWFNIEVYTNVLDT